MTANSEALRSGAAGRPKPNEPVVLDCGAPVSPALVEAVAVARAPVRIGEVAELAMARACACLDRLKAEHRLIYGVTTGYGPLARSYVGAGLNAELQRNLVYHLASGVGPLLPPDQARAVTVARLATLVRGHSAVRPQIAQALVALLNADFAPAIPAKGTVGASGDLTPLAHMALGLMGEGALIDPAGTVVPAAEGLKRIGILPVRLEDKDGLALVNGISATAGIAALNGVRALRLARLGLAAGLAYTEFLGGHREAWHPAVGRLRPHAGQVDAHELLWAWSKDAARLQPVAARPPRHAPDLSDGTVLQDQPLPQDAYTMRCLPQLIGAVFDVLRFHDDIVTRDLNGVSDNPLVFPDVEADRENADPVLLHAGNFFGQHGAFAADALTNAVIALAGLFERQIARLTDPALNGPYPAFLQARTTGLHSGFMGAQVTASALLAELRAKAVPASIQSIPTNGNNQDVVPLGTIAARRAGEALEDTTRIAAILLLCIAQAADLSKDGPPLSAKTRNLADAVRRYSAFLDADRPLSGDIATVAGAIEDAGLTV